jgi:hypothetical protein
VVNLWKTLITAGNYDLGLVDIGYGGLEGNTTVDRNVKIQRRLLQYFGILAAAPVELIFVRFWRRF